jgi:hypothetical protein
MINVTARLIEFGSLIKLTSVKSIWREKINLDGMIIVKVYFSEFMW